jgi:probable HAF family extracellular repeat protein
MTSRRFFCTILLFMTQIGLNSTLAQDQYQVRAVVNSETFSQIIALNANLDVIGSREIPEGPTRSMRNFYRGNSDEKDTEIPVPNGFTNLEVQALSDTGLVVGYISRPAGHPKGSLFAFVWNGKSKEFTQLDPLAGHTASHAQDISADGQFITGYCTGTEPPGLRPCVWHWNPATMKWDGSLLDTLLPHNPFLQASQVIISPNGQTIAACITERQLSDFSFDSSLFVWLFKDGKWERKKLSDDQFKLKDINDRGLIVGSTSTHPVIIDPDGKVTEIELLPGDETGCAYGVNNEGIVVGLSDDPHGADGGPQAFIYRDGAVSPLKLRANTFYSAALAINHDGAIGGYMVSDESEDAVTHAFLRVPAKK